MTFSHGKRETHLILESPVGTTEIILRNCFGYKKLRNVQLLEMRFVFTLKIPKELHNLIKMQIIPCKNGT